MAATEGGELSKAIVPIRSVSSSPSTEDAVSVREPIGGGRTKKEVNRGAWKEEEDEKLAEVIAIHGAKKWKTLAVKAGINRCGKSCRLRWLNYLRPNIKRGNISAEEEDLILRLHKLLGNRWSLIAGRLPGRTDNEIKNYWYSCLSKKMGRQYSQQEEEEDKQTRGCLLIRQREDETEPTSKNSLKDDGQLQAAAMEEEAAAAWAASRENENRSSDVGNGGGERDESKDKFDMEEFFDFSNEHPLNLEWIQEFLSANQKDVQ